MLRPYTSQEIVAIDRVVKEAEAHANRTANPLSDGETFRAEWNLLFHGFVESRLVEMGIRKPRSFFEANAC